MIEYQQKYSIDELCRQVIKEIQKYFNKNFITYSHLARTVRNQLVYEWIENNYQNLFDNYLKTHPLK